MIFVRSIIIIANCSIGPEGVKYIAEVLEVNINLTNLNIGINHIMIGNNNLGFKGLKYLCDSFRTNFTVRSLDLCDLYNLVIANVNIGKEGIVRIANMLENNDSLLELNLSIFIGSIGNNNMSLDVANSLFESLKLNVNLRIIILGNFIYNYR